ncbi:MAG TPA: DUF423 domain-containing protein [Fimbriimonadaceae bacterium]|nr:DUF423 domain-containing protein [Fimbriimonadaceae bacterium]HRJ96563.1 DUF423 domain-containing protein [Fimbriimonadaceae bacterium]
MEVPRQERAWIALGGLLAMLGVALGAFGAHGLRSRITPERLEVYQTGVHYHLIHALAILLVVALAGRIGSNWPRVAWLFAVGIVIFGGTLYLLAITGIGWLGAITPLGGLCFIAGWALLSLAAWREKK